MQFLTLQREGWDEPGVLYDGRVTGLKGAGFDDLLSVISGGADALDRVSRWLYSQPRSEPLDLAATRLRAPIPKPPKFICIGLNYRDHAAESKMAIPDMPTVFAKFANTVTGHLHPIVLPKNSAKPDYEAEFAVVIGKGGRHIPQDRWREHVFGYTIVNDVSARDVQFATSQWSMSKSFPTFCPLGPAIVTADEIPDPHQLAISLTIDGEVMQSSNTRELIFKIPELIEHLSSITPLLPGDIVSTGTPYGVGLGRTPKRWLKPGESVTVTIEGLGSLTNPVVAE